MRRSNRDRIEPSFPVPPRERRKANHIPIQLEHDAENIGMRRHLLASTPGTRVVLPKAVSR